LVLNSRGRMLIRDVCNTISWHDIHFDWQHFSSSSLSVLIKIAYYFIAIERKLRGKEWIWANEKQNNRKKRLNEFVQSAQRMTVCLRVSFDLNRIFNINKLRQNEIKKKPFLLTICFSWRCFVLFFFSFLCFFPCFLHVFESVPHQRFLSFRKLLNYNQ